MLKKQFTHGGEHNPNWRTREAIAAIPREDRVIISEGDLEILVPPSQGHQKDPSLGPHDEEVLLTQEQLYAQKLAELDPRMRQLRMEHFIPASDIIITPKAGQDIDSEIIGEGGQGTIFRGKLKGREGLVAIKCGHSQGIIEEFALLSSFSHENILKAHAFTIARDDDVDDEDEEGLAPRTTASTDSNGTLGFLKKQRWVYMAVYELCGGGDLQSYLDKNPNKVRDVAFIKNLFGSLIAALQCLHDKGFIHGDLKPENILIDKSGNPKLADFGMCQRISNTMVPQGTPSFLSPEVVVAWFTPTPSHHFTDKIDIFSLGAMAMYVITGRYPFKRVTARLRSGVKYSEEELGLLFKLNSKRLKEIGAVSETLAKLISHCLEAEPSRRPSAAVLLQALRA
eukprot:TRINITY_DN1267_c0_g1_i1.p1 TRINITY_DN1267_c0_g1~~TRINITY_DN1267_c0_g1_i1.p1  ORF type:complete len:397 (+),score=85.99 TRINITY_DN1267_c0_g1_i1:205-1395(+)